MKRVLSLFSAALFAGALFSTAAAGPNVLIIQTDEHNFRTLGCYRQQLPPDQAFIWGEGVKVDTPHIDSIAARGALCTRYYATSPVCTPSRAALMTGLYPQNTGSISNDLPMLDEMETFAAVLARAGYDTGYAGKWHLDGDAKPGWAPERRFGFEDNRHMFNRGHWKKLGEDANGPQVLSIDARGQPVYSVEGADEKSFTTDYLTDRAIEFVRRERGGKPFCYMVSIPDPHGPNLVRAPYDTMFDPAPFQQPKSALVKGEKLPSFAQVLEDRFNARQMALYFGMVKCIDDNIGRLLAALRETGQLENTILVFTSDHGDMCGEHGRHNKGIPCEGSARIPFVIAAPGLIPAGAVIHEALGTVDFKPTLLGLLNLKAGRPMQGRDASALLRAGRAPSDWADRAFVRIGTEGGGASWVAVFTSTHKLVLSPGDAPALFDLDKDPFELANQLDGPSQRDLIRHLARELQGYLNSSNEPLARSPAVAADLAWALSDSPEYVAAPRDNSRRAAKGKAKGKGKARGTDD